MLMPFTVTTFSGLDSQAGVRKDCNWPQLQARLCRPDFRANKRAGSGWSPARFHSYPARRLQENVAVMTLLVLDCDTEATIATAQQQAEALGLEALLHSTFSSTPDARRARAVFPLAEPVPAAEWSAFWLRARAFFTNDQADPACKDANRFYWWLSTPTPETVWTWQHAGIFLAPEMVPLLPVSETPLPPRLPVSIAPSSGESRPSPGVLLRMAVERLSLGRNESGLWLATQARDNGYSFAEVESLAWHQRVPREKLRPHGGVDVFDEREWQAIVANAFGKPARQPWAPLERSVPAARPRAAARASQRSEPPDPFADEDEPHDRDGNGNDNGNGNSPGYGSDEGHDEMGKNGNGTRGATANRNGIATVARRWADEQFGHFRFVEGDGWREYNGQKWGDVSDTTVNTQIQAWLEGRNGELTQPLTHRLLCEVRHLTEGWMGDGERPLPRARFDPDRELLPVKNGVVDLRTGKIEPHSPERLNTYVLPYVYNPDAQCPLFTQFLVEAMIHIDGTPCSEWVALLEEWIGYCLIPDSRAETLLIHCGRAGAGKSTFTHVLSALVGKDQVVGLDLKQLAGYHPAYVLAHLDGRLLALVNEPRPRDLADCAQTLYAICSGDQLQARDPGKPEFDLLPRCHVQMSCNNIPDSRDLTQALYRRMVPVEWRRARGGEFAEDKDYLAKLLHELPGILNLALKGLERVRRRGWRFDPPQESVDLKQEYQLSQDSVQQFLAACCLADPKNEDLWCRPAPLHKRYSSWCKEVGFPPLNIDAFGKHLTRQLGYPAAKSKRLKPEERSRPDEEIATVRFGIMMQEWGDSF